MSTRSDWHIYLLINPDTEAVKYAGMSKSPEDRLISHRGAAGTACVRRWIMKLRANGKMPVIRVVECAEAYKQALKREKHWIKHYESKGEMLLNVTHFKNWAWHTSVRRAFAFSCEADGQKFTLACVHELVINARFHTSINGDVQAEFRGDIDDETLNEIESAALKMDGTPRHLFTLADTYGEKIAAYVAQREASKLTK